MGVNDLENNLRLFGTHFEKTKIVSFQDENGAWVNYGDTKEGGWGKKKIQRLYRIMIQETLHGGSSGDGKGPPPSDAGVPVDTSPTGPPPPYSSIDSGSPSALQELKASMHKRIHSQAKKEYWEKIFNYVEDNFIEHAKDKLVPLVAKVLTWNPCLDGLKYCEQIIQHVKDNQLPVADQLAALEPNAAKLKYWVDIIMHMKDNQLPFVLVLATMDPPPEELEDWVKIVKHGKENQLSIIGRLAATKFLGLRLKHWVEIVKHIEDNQLLIVNQLAAMEPSYTELGEWRVVNGCG